MSERMHPITPDAERDKTQPITLDGRDGWANLSVDVIEVFKVIKSINDLGFFIGVAS